MSQNRLRDQPHNLMRKNSREATGRRRDKVRNGTEDRQISGRVDSNPINVFCLAGVTRGKFLGLCLVQELTL